MLINKAVKNKRHHQTFNDCLWICMKINLSRKTVSLRIKVIEPEKFTMNITNTTVKNLLKLTNSVCYHDLAKLVQLFVFFDVVINNNIMSIT